MTVTLENLGLGSEDVALPAFPHLDPDAPAELGHIDGSIRATMRGRATELEKANRLRAPHDGERRAVINAAAVKTLGDLGDKLTAYERAHQTRRATWDTDAEAIAWHRAFPAVKVTRVLGEEDGGRVARSAVQAAEREGAITRAQGTLYEVLRPLGPEQRQGFVMQLAFGTPTSVSLLLLLRQEPAVLEAWGLATATLDLVRDRVRAAAGDQGTLTALKLEADALEQVTAMLITARRQVDSAASPTVERLIAAELDQPADGDEDAAPADGDEEMKHDRGAEREMVGRSLARRGEEN